MRRCFALILILTSVTITFSAQGATGRVNKALPHFLDLQGRHTLSPSLFDRDAYQAKLRDNPALRSGVRFDVHWRARAAAGTKVKLRVELRGAAQGDHPSSQTLEKELAASATSKWTSFTLSGDEYKKFGEITAWRVTLWDGEQLVGEQKSFLW